MEPSKVKIEESWRTFLAEEFGKAYFDEIVTFLKNEKSSNKVIYPSGTDIFKAFELTPLDKVKTIILGQDPYHNPNEAMGLCFSVPNNIKVPPSLKNIYKELETDIGMPIPNHGNLTNWATQGVLLLNAMLTVEHKKPGSHRKIGWQQFTDAIIQKLSTEKENLVFLLWGNFAKGKSELIDHSKHLVLQAAHPSPLARGAFFGSKHFSQTNDYLKLKNKTPIGWTL